MENHENKGYNQSKNHLSNHRVVESAIAKWPGRLCSAYRIAYATLLFLQRMSPNVWVSPLCVTPCWFPVGEATNGLPKKVPL